MICLAKAIQDGNKKPLFHSGRPHPWDEGASWFLQPLQSDEMLIRSHLFFVVFFFARTVCFAGCSPTCTKSAICKIFTPSYSVSYCAVCWGRLRRSWIFHNSSITFNFNLWDLLDTNLHRAAEACFHVFFLMPCYFCFQAIFINNVFICPAKMGALGNP